MADIRIKDLATTAASSASDDYVAIDGSANGTRKLSAYNPSFGGTGTFGGAVTINSNVSYIGKSGSGNGGNWRFVSDDGTTRWLAGLLGTGGETTFSIYDLVNSRQTLALTAAGNATLAGNLTVSGTGTSSIAGNLLVGTTTDGGQKLQVAGTAYVSGDATFAGTGAQSIAGVVKFSAPSNIGAGTYAWIGGDGSTGMFLNAPTGSTVQFGVNNSGKLIVNSTTIKIVSIPTSSAGLPAGSVWNDGGTLKIV